MYSFRKHFYRHGKTICLLSTTALVNTPATKDVDNMKIAVHNNKAEEDKKPLDGWDRLALMYSENEFGELSNELSAVINAGSMLFLIGSTYGITRNTKEAYTNFIEKNQASQFASVFEAKKKLQDRVMMAAFKGWFQYGVKLTAFSTCMLLGTTSMMVYTGYSSVFHYGLAASVFGVVYRWKLGPRGMLVGGTVGGILGLFAGLSTNGLLYMFDSSLDDFITANAEQYKSRNKKEKEIHDTEIRTDAAPDALKLVEGHTEFVEQLQQSEKLSDESKK